MNEEFAIDYEALIHEIERYLAVVDLYRAEHCEPNWQPELVSDSEHSTTRWPVRLGVS